jgi:hypothetical protein
MYCPSCKKPVTRMTTIGEDGKATRLEIADYLMRNECPYCSGPLVIEPEITFREIKSTTYVPDEPKPSRLPIILGVAWKVLYVAGLSAVVGVVGLGLVLVTVEVFLDFPFYIVFPGLVLIAVILWFGAKLNRLIKAIEEQKRSDA